MRYVLLLSLLCSTFLFSMIASADEPITVVLPPPRIISDAEFNQCREDITDYLLDSAPAQRCDPHFVANMFHKTRCPDELINEFRHRVQPLVDDFQATSCHEINVSALVDRPYMIPPHPEGTQSPEVSDESSVSAQVPFAVSVPFVLLHRV